MLAVLADSFNHDRDGMRHFFFRQQQHLFPDNFRHDELFWIITDLIRRIILHAVGQIIFGHFNQLIQVVLRLRADRNDLFEIHPLLPR